MAGCGLSTVPQPVPPVPPQPQDLRAAPACVVDRMRRAAPDLYFDFNSHTLPAHEQGTLAEIAPALQDILHDFPGLIIVIEGHSDDRGLIEYNVRLALQRADTVRQALVNINLPRRPLRTVSYGYPAPQFLTHAAMCRQKNRRVHLRVALPVSDTRDEKLSLHRKSANASSNPGAPKSIFGNEAIVRTVGGMWAMQAPMISVPLHQRFDNCRALALAIGRCDRLDTS